MLIDPPAHTISQFVDEKLVPLTQDVQQLAGSACWIDWRWVRQMLDE